MSHAANLWAGSALVFSLGVMGCHSAPSKRRVAAVGERHDAGVVDALRLASTSPDAPGMSHPTAAEADAGCALDIGGGRSGSRTEIGADGVLRIVHPQTRCWFEADCIRDHARDSPGDALVSIDCRGRHCACTFESLTPRRYPVTFSFDAEDPCQDGRIENLLLGRRVSEGRRRVATRSR